MTQGLPASAEAMSYALCRNEMQRWIGRGIDRAAFETEARRLDENTYSIFLFEIEGDHVELVPKAEHLRIEMVVARAHAYRDYLAAVVAAHPLAKSVLLAVQVGDGPLNSDIFPFFSFQKLVGDPTILLPDVNLLEGEYYEGAGFHDPVAFAHKADKAVFVGSTSGSTNTLASLAAGANERIEAAVFFKDHPAVDFWLPSIVQSDDETRAAIYAMELGHRIIGWPEQFGYKLLLSLDGNGAACQRIAVALKSNSVVLKYHSPSVLHYFHGLVPWLHYVPIHSNAEVIRLVETEIGDRRLADIATAGQSFAERYLSRGATIAYGAMLLHAYADLDWM